MPSNPFVHVELATTDVPKAKEFYGKLFDWQLNDDSGVDGYTTIGVGENEYGVGGGMMHVPQEGMSTTWLAYVAVGDIKAATERARSLGATILTDVTEIGPVGWLSVIQDPTGGVLGLFQGKQG
ncbi:MAG TPA: VOC family protein [Candidatus Tumulicola sp.]|nr:VOC family protein [Candidatus Tumulicola sp.]